MKDMLALGIDIGGTNTEYGLVNKRGEIIIKGNFPTAGHDTAEDYIAALKKTLLPVLEKAGKKNITGVGIGAPSANFFTGEIVDAPNMPWPGIIPMAKLVSEALGIKATLTNDANAAAIGEMMY